MLALLQRVTGAEVDVAGEIVGRIERGLLVFLGVEKGDGEREADRLLERVLGYRVFSDEHGKMNLSLTDIGAGLLLVPQFTLPADTRKGMRASLSSAAPPEEGQRLFGYLLERAGARHSPVASGRFGAHMAVTLTNDGPVTFLLRARPPAGAWPAP
ncbi:MAG: D-aminoacyl-tRNA deacylase [Gammaproteobacteria bacterium]|nr:D-aminoacyl-tRNA deacylase [Gammaproteobacteria bacterium]